MAQYAGLQGSPPINQPTQGLQGLGVQPVPTQQNMGIGRQGFNQQPQQGQGFQEHIKTELASAKKALSIIKDAGFSAGTKLKALDSFFGGFGKVFGPNDNVGKITLEQFKTNETSFRQAADKIVRQIEMVEKGQLQLEDFLDTAGDVYNDVIDDISRNQFQVENENRGQPGKVLGTGLVQEFTGNRLTGEQKFESIGANIQQPATLEEQTAPVNGGVPGWKLGQIWFTPKQQSQLEARMPQSMPREYRSAILTMATDEAKSRNIPIETVVDEHVQRYQRTGKVGYGQPAGDSGNKDFSHLWR